MYSNILSTNYAKRSKLVASEGNRHHLRLTQVGAKPGQAAPSLGAHRWHSRLPIVDPRGLGGGNVLSGSSLHFAQSTFLEVEIDICQQKL